jgi:hypothetical protein
VFTPRTACSEMDPGTFANETGTSLPANCPEGTYSVGGYIPAKFRNNTPGFLFTTCEPCEPGRFTDQVHTAFSCTPCEKGRATGFYGTVTCGICTIGLVATTTGLTFCDVCKAGYYTNTNQAQTCLAVRSPPPLPAGCALDDACAHSARPALPRRKTPATSVVAAFPASTRPQRRRRRACRARRASPTTASAARPVCCARRDCSPTRPGAPRACLAPSASAPTAASLSAPTACRASRSRESRPRSATRATAGPTPPSTAPVRAWTVREASTQTPCR